MSRLIKAACDLIHAANKADIHITIVRQEGMKVYQEFCEALNEAYVETEDSKQEDYGDLSL